MNNRKILVIDGYELTEALQVQYNWDYGWYNLKRDVLDIDPLSMPYYHIILEELDEEESAEFKCLYTYLKDIYPEETEILIEF